ncbi:MAG: GNAT family N-acetyltransferase [Arenicellales bacterium]
MSYQIRDVDSQSVHHVHRMNERALPQVNSVALSYFLAQIDNDSYFREIRRGSETAAFLLAMNEQADYDSPNFLWFRDRYPRFVYIDRVVVSAAHRRSGLGASLYQDIAQWAGERAPILACEVNLRPSNEPSLRFHERQGFTPVGTQNTERGHKTVSLMIKELDARSPRH